MLGDEVAQQRAIVRGDEELGAGVLEERAEVHSNRLLRDVAVAVRLRLHVQRVNLRLQLEQRCHVLDARRPNRHRERRSWGVPSSRRDTSHAWRANASTQARARASPSSVRASTDTNPTSGALATSSACCAVSVRTVLSLYARTCDAARAP